MNTYEQIIGFLVLLIIVLCWMLFRATMWASYWRTKYENVEFRQEIDLRGLADYKVWRDQGMM